MTAGYSQRASDPFCPIPPSIPNAGHVEPSSDAKQAEWSRWGMLTPRPCYSASPHYLEEPLFRKGGHYLFDTSPSSCKEAIFEKPSRKKARSVKARCEFNGSIELLTPGIENPRP